MKSGAGMEPAIYYEYRAPWLAPLDRAALGDALKLMQRAAGLGQSHIELYLVDDGHIAALNRQFLGCAGPTNIITFPASRGMAGSLFLSLDTSARECGLYGQKGAEHFLRLIAHGFGHLKGFEHGPRLERIERACYAACEDIIKQGHGNDSQI